MGNSVGKSNPFDPEAIIALLKELYAVILLTQNFSSIEPQAHIIFGPHAPSSFDPAPFRDAGMAEEVISLLSRVPYLSFYQEKIAPDTSPQKYLKEGREIDENLGFEAWRDPFGLYGSDEEEEERGYLGKWCVPLTSSRTRGGFCLILDCEMNEIFEVNWFGDPAQQPEAPIGASEQYFRHYPSGPAHQILKKWIERYRKLEYVPDYTSVDWWLGEEGEHGGGDEAVATRDLLRCHGWPDKLRVEEFKVAKENFVEDVREKRRGEMEEEQEELKRQAKEWLRKTYGDE